MRRTLEYTLPTPERAIGHWRFRQSLSDDSLATNGLVAGTLTGYTAGHTEDGVTAIQLRGTGAGVRIAAAEASDFEIGSESITIEAWHKADMANNRWIVRKADAGGGWGIGLVTDGSNFRPCVMLDDGGGAAYFYGTPTYPSTITDSAWELWQIVIDRANSELRLYIDGVEDASSPFDISAVGSVTAPTTDLQIGESYKGLIDELCITAEALTDALLVERAAGNLLEIWPDDDDEFLLRFLPRINHDNPELLEFLTPQTRQYRGLRVLADQLARLPLWDRCPDRYLDLLASNIGFELPHSSYASSKERRELLANAVTVYRHKGTRWAPHLIMGLLGYGYTWGENFAEWVPFRANVHRLAARSRFAEDSFRDDFSAGNLTKWNKSLSLDAWWRIESGRLVGSGDGTNSPTNGITFSDSATSYFIDISFEVQSGYAADAALAVYLKYIDADNYARIEFRHAAGVDRILWADEVGAVGYGATLFSFSDANNWSTGQHRIRIHVDAANDTYTVCLNDVTYVYQFTRATPGLAPGKKGLFVNKNFTVAFDSVVVQTNPAHQTIRTLSDTWSQRSVDIGLLTAPANDSDKRLYLKKVLPRYLPAGVQLNLS